MSLMRNRWILLSTLACSAGAAFACSDDPTSSPPKGTGGSAATGGAGAKSGGAPSGGSGGAGVTGGSTVGGAGMGGSSAGGSGGVNVASGGQAGGTGLAGSGGASGGAPSSSGGAAGQAGAVAGAAGSGGQTATVYTEFSSAVPLSPTDADRFFGATFDQQGRVYATGYVVGGNGDSRMVLVRFLSNGNLDTSFGTFGVVTLNATVGAGTTDQGRAVRVQADGKIVVAGFTQNASIATDTDIVVARFTSSGMLDTTFGDLGVTILDISTATPKIDPKAYAPDALGNMDLDAADRIVLFGMTEALDSRTDQDRFVARLSKDGLLDTSFAAASIRPGVFTHDEDALGQADFARGGFVQADGKIFAAGYTPVGGNNEVVLVRLNDNGTPDNSFSGDGVVRSAVFAAPGMAEAYGAVRQSNGSYVTTGYGRELANPAPVDLVSFRYGADGARDAGWNTVGALIHDVGANDRGRNLLGLPGDRVVMVGTATPIASEDAMVVLVQNTGALESSFGTIATPGYRLFDFGGADEEFYGVALSPDNGLLAIVGYRSGGSVMNDDATLLLLPVPVP